MTATYYKLLEFLDNHGIDIDNNSDLGKILHDYCKDSGIQVTPFKDNRKSLYNQRGYKVRDALLAHKEATGGEIYSCAINMGEMPLKDENTAKLAKRLRDGFVPKDSPSRTKVEKGITRNDLAHTHILYSSPVPPPDKIKIGKKTYEINSTIVGSNPQYNERWDYQEQVKRMVTYLYKPGNMAGAGWHSRADIRYAAYLEWFLEQRELSKLTLIQRRKLKGVRLAWNKNIKSQ